MYFLLLDSDLVQSLWVPVVFPLVWVSTLIFGVFCLCKCTYFLFLFLPLEEGRLVVAETYSSQKLHVPPTTLRRL